MNTTTNYDYKEIKNREIEHAIKVIDDIASSKDPYLRYKTGRPITDIKEMFESSVRKYGDNVAFRQKFKKGEPYTEITYKEALEDVNGLGTALINMGLKGKRISIIGDTNYQWESTYLAVIGGVGIVVPLDKELGKDDLEYLIKDADVSAIFYGKKYDSIFREMKESDNTSLEFLVNMDIESEENGVHSWRELIEEGKKA